MAERKAKKEEPREVGFEKALTRLESLVAEMEKGELSLDDMMSRFEEGQSLVGYCTRKLDDVEKRVELLLQQDGKVRAVPFDPADQAGEAGDSGAERDEDAEEDEGAGAAGSAPF